MPRPTDRDHQRWLHAIEVAGDMAKTDRQRTAAIARIQACLPKENSLKNVKPSVLLQRILFPWDVRVYRYPRHGGTFEAEVRRPAQELADLF